MSSTFELGTTFGTKSDLMFAVACFCASQDRNFSHNNQTTIYKSFACETPKCRFFVGASRQKDEISWRITSVSSHSCENPQKRARGKRSTPFVPLDVCWLLSWAGSKWSGCSWTRWLTITILQYLQLKNIVAYTLPPKFCYLVKEACAIELFGPRKFRFNHFWWLGCKLLGSRSS